MIGNINLKTEWIRAKYKVRRFHIRHPIVLNTLLGILVGILVTTLAAIYFTKTVDFQPAQKVASKVDSKNKDSKKAQENISQVASRSPTAIAAAAEKASVVIRSQNRRGSGFFIAPDLLLTNFHVIKGASKLRIRPTNSRETLDVRAIVGFDEATDLIVLQTEQKSPGWLTLADEDASAIGDSVYTYGAPKGIEGTFTQGILSNIRSRRGVRVFQVTAPISSGSSGGPVFNSDGKVIGVSTAIVKGGQNLNVVMPIGNLSSLLIRDLMKADEEIEVEIRSELKPLFAQYCRALAQVNLAPEKFRDVKRNDLLAGARGEECKAKVGSCHRSAYKESEKLLRYMYVGIKEQLNPNPEKRLQQNKLTLRRLKAKMEFNEETTLVHSQPKDDVFEVEMEATKESGDLLEIESIRHYSLALGCEMTLVSGVRSSFGDSAWIRNEFNKLDGSVESQLRRRLPMTPRPQLVMGWQKERHSEDLSLQSAETQDASDEE
ncbi:MAG: S1C family serine protease [Pseudomonadota bacterium]